MRVLRTLSTIVIGAAAVAAAVATPAYASAPSTHAEASHAQAAPFRIVTSAGTFTVEVVHRSGVVPFSDSGCTGDLPWDNISTCIAIDGDGLYTRTMTGDSDVKNYAVVEHVLLSGPSVYYNTPDFVVDVGEFIQVTWWPYRDIGAGSYCATSWVVSGSGYSNQGSACQPVHP